MATKKKDRKRFPVCAFPGCTIPPPTNTARYCDEHRDEIKAKSKRSLSRDRTIALTRRYGENTRLQPPPAGVDIQRLPTPDPRKYESDDCPHRAAVVAEILKRRKAYRRPL